MFTESKNQNVSCTSSSKVMLPTAHCVACNSKKDKLGLLKIKKQVVSAWLAKFKVLHD